MKQVVLILPIRTFKERLRLTNEYLKKGYRIENIDNKLLFCERWVNNGNCN